MNPRQFRRVRQFSLRAFPALVLTLIGCSASFSQQITCPVTGEFDNSGTTSNSQNPCVIQPGAKFINEINANFTNTQGATLVNSSGATLTLQTSSVVENDGTFTNNGGVNDAGQLTNGGTIAGGTLNTTNTISILGGGTLINGGTLTGATINVGLVGTLGIFGQLTNAENSTINSAGTIFNDGTLTNSRGTITNFLGTIDNNGAFDNSTGTLNNLGSITNFVGSTITNGLLNNNGTLTNFGTFNNSDGNIVNSGTLENRGNLFSALFTNNSGATILNDAGAALSNSGTLTNAGAITNNGNIANFGTVNIQGGGVLSNLAGSTYSQTAGQTVVDGTLNSVSAVQIVLGGLSGTGTINGSVTNSFGTVQPGDALGTLAINGDYTQGSRGTLVIELDGTANGNFDVLDVSGLATLDGLVDFTAMNGFAPVAGDDFVFLLFDSNSGNFSKVDFTNWSCPVNDTCTDVLGPNSLSLEINGTTTPTPEPSPVFLLGIALLALGVCYRWKRTAAIA